MITTSEIAPSPALAPFVRCYALREFDTKGLDLIKPWHASHEITMPFFFKAKPVQLTHPQTGKVIKRGSYGGLTGSGTQYNGEMTFNGSYSFFEVCFRPDGFTKMFRLPSSKITNQIIDAEDIFGSSVKIFFEQLCAAKNLAEMASLADSYLLVFLRKQKPAMQKDAISTSADLILKNTGLLPVEQLACYANMSIRSFERHFIEQVGISPKLFSCIARFNRAFALKLKRPEKSWTSIAYDCGYFDQMHLIKDFRKFAGNSPSVFLEHTPLTKEIYTNRIEV
ncbi:helix-turn-helix domain-containing protein [Pontibacter chitinilyticus]|uniref:helix-turn-helix domain-containing protein n=1 Tax=Pontibacter chitinilyticus TaxID=2674989 RepID=UPI0032191493